MLFLTSTTLYSHIHLYRGAVHSRITDFYILIIWVLCKKIFIRSWRFATHWVRKKYFLQKCLSVCPVSMGTTTLDRIIGLDKNLIHLLRAQKERMSSLISHSLPMVLFFLRVISFHLFIKKVFMKIKNSIFPPKYTICKKW